MEAKQACECEHEGHFSDALTIGGCHQYGERRTGTLAVHIPGAGTFRLCRECRTQCHHLDLPQDRS